MPPSPPYVLGIDAGTEAVKAGVFDLQGRLIASGSRPYPTHFPRPGWAEQDSDDWWAGLVGAVPNVTRRTTFSSANTNGPMAR